MLTAAVATPEDERQMTITRRNLLGSILALGVAPAIVRPQSLMRIAPLITPGVGYVVFESVDLMRFLVVPPSIILAPRIGDLVVQRGNWGTN